RRRRLGAAVEGRVGRAHRPTRCARPRVLAALGSRDRRRRPPRTCARGGRGVLTTLKILGMMMRRPFITSVTLLATACGASSTDAEPNDSAAAHDAAEADVVSADSPPDAAEGCPAERPIYGGSCSVPKTSRCT